MKTAQSEALLEGGRVVLLAVVSYLLTEGVLATTLDLIFGVRLDATAKALLTGLVTTVLRSVDKYLHEASKTEQKPNEGLLGEKGLTGF